MKKYCNDLVPKLGLIVSSSRFLCPYCHKAWERGGHKEGFVKSGASNHVFTCYELLLWRLGYLIGNYVVRRGTSLALPIIDKTIPGRKETLSNLRAAWRKRQLAGMLPEIPKSQKTAKKGTRP